MGRYTKCVQKVQPEPEALSLCTLTTFILHTLQPASYDFSRHHKLSFSLLTSACTVPFLNTGVGEDQYILVKMLARFSAGTVEPFTVHATAS